MTEPIEDLEQTLLRFTGTEAYHRFNPASSRCRHRSRTGCAKLPGLFRALEGIAHDTRIEGYRTQARARKPCTADLRALAPLE